MTFSLQAALLATLAVALVSTTAAHAKVALSPGVCAVPESQRLNCGFSGISRSQCLRANCCWAPDHSELHSRPASTCFHRVQIANLEDRKVITENVPQHEVHTWRVYNARGETPARFVLHFPESSDVDLFVKCCDSRGGASPSCPSLVDYDYSSRALPRRSPFRYDVYDQDAQQCGEWGVMVHGVGRGNHTYQIYRELDRNQTVVEMRGYDIHKGNMIRDDWHFYRVHLRRAYNVHVPIQISNYAPRQSTRAVGSEIKGSSSVRWSTTIPYNARAIRGFSTATLAISGYACPVSRTRSARVAFHGETFASYSTSTSSCGTDRTSVDVTARLTKLIQRIEMPGNATEFPLSATGFLSGTSTNLALSWTLTFTYNAEVAVYAQWNHFPHWYSGAHFKEVRAFEGSNRLCVRLDFDEPKTGMLYVGFNATSENVGYEIQSLINNRGACEIDRS